STTAPDPAHPGQTVDMAQAFLFFGSAPSAAVTAEDRQDGVSNYFTGSDPSAWRTDVPHYGQGRYPDVWPGGDGGFRSHGGRLAYDFEVAAGALEGMKRAGLMLPWARSVRVDDAGRLLLDTGAGEVAQSAPVAYQALPDGSRRAVRSAYQLKGPNLVGFQVA